MKKYSKYIGIIIVIIVVVCIAAVNIHFDYGRKTDDRRLRCGNDHQGLFPGRKPDEEGGEGQEG